MSYVDLEIGFRPHEDPTTIYALLARELPVTFSVIENHPQATVPGYPIVRFVGPANALRELLRRVAAHFGEATEHEIHAVTREEHHEVLKTMGSELAEAFNRGDDGAVDHVYDRLCRYVEEHLGPHVVPVMVVQVERCSRPSN